MAAARAVATVAAARAAVATVAVWVAAKVAAVRAEAKAVVATAAAWATMRRSVGGGGGIEWTQNHRMAAPSPAVGWR